MNGLQFFAFGSFYKASWRANDWMWGRLDGARRFTAVLLDPARVLEVSRQWPVGERAIEFSRKVVAIAAGPVDSSTYAVMRDLIKEPAMLRELAFLDDPNLIVPGRLPACLDALVSRQQLDILREELPRVVAEIMAEKKFGLRISLATQRFLDFCVPRIVDHRLVAEHVSGAMDRYAVGRERLADEIGTDRFAALVAQMLCVGLAVLRNESGSYAALSKTLGSLRLPLVTGYIFIRNIARRSHVGAVVNTLVLGAGLTALVLLPQLDHHVNKAPIFLVAAGAIIAAIVWFALRLPSWISGAFLVLGSLASLLCVDIATKVLPLSVKHGASGISAALYEPHLTVTVSDANIRLAGACVCAVLAILLLRLGDLFLPKKEARVKVRDAKRPGLRASFGWPRSRR